MSIQIFLHLHGGARFLAVAFSSLAFATTSANAQCVADINGNAVVDGTDLTDLLSMWGHVGDVFADINNDGVVDANDLAAILAQWGPCAGPAWATVIEWTPNSTVITDAWFRSTISATGFPWRVRDNASNIEMLLVPPGTFTMGCTASWQFPCDANEYPSHQVTLTNAYYLGRYEVTQAQWSAEMGSNPSYFWNFANSPSRPVEKIDWFDTQDFLAQTGLRLPTEAEWEYAYRAGTTTAFHNGSSNDNTLGTIAWYYNTSGAMSHAVGGKPANALGMHDMAGNVLEWVNDWYDLYPFSTATNPTGPTTGTNRIVRGGFWFSDSNYCRASSRVGADPEYAENRLGFRVARNP